MEGSQNHIKQEVRCTQKEVGGDLYFMNCLFTILHQWLGGFQPPFKQFEFERELMLQEETFTP